MKREALKAAYGSTALVVGASEGLGAAWAEALADAGLDLVLVARRGDVLAAFAAELRRRHGGRVDTIVGDLRRPDFLEDEPQDGIRGRQIDVVVANAAVSPIGPFIDADADELLSAVEVNVVGALRLASALLPPMAARRRGAFVVMSSLAGLQGSPNLAVYAATKAYLNVFAEGLWSELRQHDVDVLACTAGAVATPGYGAATSSRAPGTLEPGQVVNEAIAALGNGPRVIPGFTNKAAAVVMGRLLGRRAAVAIMRRVNRRLVASSA